MLNETYDTQQADAEAYNAYLDQIREYEQRMRWVFCDICNIQAHGTQQQLERSDWTLGKGFEFCPNH